MRAPAGSSAEPGWAWPSAANWPICWAAKSSSRARPAREAHSRSICRKPTWAPSAPPRGQDSRERLAFSTQATSSRQSPRPSRKCGSKTIALTSQPGDAVLLIVEDDPHYARVLCDLSRDKGFKVLIATTGSRGAGAGARVQSDRHLARRLPARHARLDRAEPSEAGRRRPATFPFRCSRWTRTGISGCRAARSRMSPNLRRPRISMPRSRASGNTRNRGASACCWWKTIRRSS